MTPIYIPYFVGSTFVEYFCVIYTVQFGYLVLKAHNSTKWIDAEHLMSFNCFPADIEKSKIRWKYYNLLYKLLIQLLIDE